MPNPVAQHSGDHKQLSEDPGTMLAPSSLRGPCHPPWAESRRRPESRVWVTQCPHQARGPFPPPLKTFPRGQGPRWCLKQGLDAPGQRRPPLRVLLSPPAPVLGVAMFEDGERLGTLPLVLDLPGATRHPGALNTERCSILQAARPDGPWRVITAFCLSDFCPGLVFPSTVCPL